MLPGEGMEKAATFLVYKKHGALAICISNWNNLSFAGSWIEVELAGDELK